MQKSPIKSIKEQLELISMAWCGILWYFGMVVWCSTVCTVCKSICLCAHPFACLASVWIFARMLFVCVCVQLHVDNSQAFV